MIPTFGIRWALMPVVVVLALIATHAEAALVVESEPNNTLGTAQNIDGFFDLSFDANIGDFTTNTSTSIPHATVSATGDGTFDYFSFTHAGGIIILDIDMTVGFDSSLRLFRSPSSLILVSNNSVTTWGALGSVTSLDTFVAGGFSPGSYIVEVSRCCFAPLPGPGPLAYLLQISSQGHPLISAVPEPGTLAILAFGLAGLGFMARRRKRTA